jgi:UDP-N-acetylmuramate--alanine ligase
VDDPRLIELRREFDAVRQALGRGPGRAHLLGIGGVGMAAVAVQLRSRGYVVSGCDARPGSVARWLEARGIPVQPGHAAAHLTGRERLVVRSPAVSADELECEQARQARVAALPARHRAARPDRGPALHRGGRNPRQDHHHSDARAHAARVSVDVSFCIGGEADHLGGVAGVGQAGLVVVEADESDGTLALYAPTYAVITNVELDHADYFRNDAELDGCFGAFASQAAGGGGVRRG